MRETTPATRRAPSDGSSNRQARTPLRTLAAEKNRRRSSGSFIATNAPITCSNDDIAPIGSSDPSAVVEWVTTTRSVISRQPSGGGDASVQRSTGGFVSAKIGIQNGQDRYTMALVVAHELGHVLGLGHEDRICATMKSKLS